MIGYLDVEKLLATRSEDQPVLSLYLEVPQDPSGLRELPARAGELLGTARTPTGFWRMSGMKYDVFSMRACATGLAIVSRCSSAVRRG